jgi:hypothetical protein
MTEWQLYLVISAGFAAGVALAFPFANEICSLLGSVIALADRLESKRGRSTSRKGDAQDIEANQTR